MAGDARPSTDDRRARAGRRLVKRILKGVHWSRAGVRWEVEEVGMVVREVSGSEVDAKARRGETSEG